MPEFCTWWIDSGPISFTWSSSASCDETMCFVSWSAMIAAIATAPSASHSVGPAASERDAVENGVSPSVAEPTRTSGG